MKATRNTVMSRVFSGHLLAGASALVIALGAIACGGSSSGAAKSDDQALRDVIEREAEAIRDEDWGELFDLQSPNRQEACDRDGWEEALAALYDEAYEDTSKVEYEVDEIVIDGDRATVTLTESYDGEEVGTDDFEYIKVGGDWHSAETSCPGGSARSASDDDSGEPSSGGDDIAELRAVLVRIAEDGSDGDLDSALEMKDTMTRYLMRVRAGADQSSHYYLDDAWSRFVKMAESDSEEIRFTAAFVQAGVVVGYIDDAEAALERAASDKTRTADRGTPTARATSGVAQPTIRATVRAGSPTVRAGTPTATLQDGPYGSIGIVTGTINGQAFEIRGSRCELMEGTTFMALDISDGSRVTATLRVRIDGSGGSMGLTVAGIWYTTTTGAGTLFELAPDRMSGTFSGPFVDGDGADGGTNISGTFSC